MAYIIVIEVDNKRAAAAYRKGYEDIQRLWPQIEAYAAKLDEKAEAKYQEEAEKEEARVRAYKAELQAAIEVRARAEKAEKDWQSASPWQRLVGDPPPGLHSRVSLPEPPHINLSHRYKPRPAIDRFESIRDDVKHMLDVAEAATGPYRMTEHQVAEMVKWEDDTHIDRIKKEISNVENSEVADCYPHYWSSHPHYWSSRVY